MFLHAQPFSYAVIITETGLSAGSKRTQAFSPGPFVDFLFGKEPLTPLSRPFLTATPMQVLLSSTWLYPELQIA